MKILHINTENGWRGGERQTVLTLTGLRRRGIAADLVAQPDSPLLREARACGVSVHALSMKGSTDVMAAWRLARMVRAGGYDLVHAQTAHAVNIALVARGLHRQPYLIASRRVDFDIASAWKYNSCDAVAPISRAISDILTRAGVKREKIHLIPSGIDVAVTRPDNIATLRAELAGGARWLVGAVGHLADHKGHRHLLAAMPQVLRRVPEMRLVIVGDGELRAELEEKARELELGTAVHFTGFRADAQDLLWAFDLLVQPSVLEGLSTTVLDALVRGVPVVASAVGGLPEAVADGRHGALVPPSNPEALAQKIADVLLDNRYREELIIGAADWVRATYSDDAMVEKTLALYRQLLGENESGR